MSAVTMNSIRINQLGFYPESVKTFVSVNGKGTTFLILNQKGEKVFTGSLVDRGTWLSSGEEVKTGDFSSLTEPGLYSVVIDGSEPSLPFTISENLYREAARDVLKAFTFQRCQHDDGDCPFHRSSGRSEGTLNSPGGWYDAGDYGKYVVTGAFSVGVMLALHDVIPGYYKEDEKDALLEEVRFELDWMMTMQDEDGGVYHKITSLNHDDFVLPEKARNRRMVIGKSTAATLDFAAAMAQAARIWEKEDRDFSREALTAARKAWRWACENGEEFFANPEDCYTGEYGDRDMTEEFFWAAAELYAVTGEAEFGNQIKEKLSRITFPVGENWRQYMTNLGYYSLLASEKVSPEEKAQIKSGLERLAEELLATMEKVPYQIPLDDFQWGSNSDILDGAMILALAHHHLGKKSYLEGAIKTTDYIFGKNAMGLSFLTGYGVKSPRHPHHRLFVERKMPEPGFVVGGPNGNREDAPDLRKEGIYYPTCLPARAYVDVVESYASNEICINWNAPAVFVLAYLERAFL
ncbi:MAG: glycoside hydrolase family 9 protein [Spirochaetales bacterium]|nr:glycoside hydrolase family 9 protein [Spirochaetales bacterium]